MKEGKCEPPEAGEITQLEIEDSIDLHGFQPRDVPSVVESYLEAAREKGFCEVRLIHGRGRGVQRARVHRLLSKIAQSETPWVIDFYDAPAHRGGWGATIVHLAPLHLTPLHAEPNSPSDLSISPSIGPSSDPSIGESGTDTAEVGKVADPSSFEDECSPQIQSQTQAQTQPQTQLPTQPHTQPRTQRQTPSLVARLRRHLRALLTRSVD